jgi:hypothetical protein
MATLLDKFKLSWNVFSGKLQLNENLFNEAIYKLVGGQTNTYNSTLEVLLTKGYGENPDVNAIVNQQASKTTIVPWVIKKIDDEASYQKSRRFPIDPTYLQKKRLLAIEKKAFNPIEQKMPLERPNPNQTWTDIMFLFKVYLKVCGNFYLYKMAPKEGINAGKPMLVYVLPAHWMQIVLKPGADLLSIENPIDYYIMQQGNQFVKFPASSIIHIKRANPFYDQSGSHLYGFSELMAAIRNINSSNNAIDQNGKTMLNSGVYGFIHAGDGQNALTAEQAESLKERLVEMDNSSKKLSNIAGASAKLGFTRISLTTEELKPFDYLSYDRKTLCNCLNWPDELMNNDIGGGMNSQKEIQARKRAITDNIKPDLDLLADSLNKEFIPLFKGYEKSIIQFDITELPEMQTDMSEMAKWVNAVPLTLNEKRDVFNYEPNDSEMMDDIYLPSGITNINDVTTQDLGL